MADSIGLFIGLMLTLFVYSYLVGDNPLYRAAVHLLVGVSAAYAAVVALERIVLPVLARLIVDPGSDGNVAWLIPLGLAVLLLFKAVRPVSWLGNSTVAVVVAIGAAVALVGAISGTIMPQISTRAGQGPLELLLVTLLTIAVLLYFKFSSSRQQEDEANAGPGTRSVRAVGQLVLLITFGAVFAGVFTTSLLVLIERVTFFIGGLSSLIGLILL